MKFNIFKWFNNKNGKNSDDSSSGASQNQFSAKNKIYLCVAGILALVIIAIFISSFSTQKAKNKVAVKSSSYVSQNFVEYTENRLSKILSSVKGLSNVEVFVTVNSSPKFIYAEDLTKTENNGSISQSSSIVIVKDGTTTSPAVSVELYPKVEGILIVAKGAGNLKTKMLLADSISAVMGVPTSCIQILEGK